MVTGHLLCRTPPRHKQLAWPNVCSQLLDDFWLVVAGYFLAANLMRIRRVT
jgi:hypothetical protein